MLRSAFTLIELLVVVAIIAILAVVVILVLNPAELLKQSRDAQRFSDLASMNTALGVFNEDVSQGSLGTASTTYISVPDPAATSTAGDQCQGLTLPALTTSTGLSYHCAAVTNYRNVDGTGWLPPNMQLISAGSPLGSLPIDPVNQTSSNFYYAYSTDGTRYEIAAIPESTKQRSANTLSPSITNIPGVLTIGTNPSVLALYNTSGLVGYWNLDEGGGNIANDRSGKMITGNISGSAVWTSGKVGAYALSLQPSQNIAYLPTSSLPTSVMTASAWINITSNANFMIFNNYWATVPGAWIFYTNNVAGGSLDFGVADNSLGTHQVTCPITQNTWHLVTGTYDGVFVSAYLDGKLCQQTPLSNQTLTTIITVQSLASTIGSIDDIRLYNRALSAAEIQSLYNAQK